MDLEFLKAMGCEVNKIYDLTAETNKLDEMNFLLFLCMAFDEYKAHHEDFNKKEAFETVRKFVFMVEEQLGDYTAEESDRARAEAEKVRA